MNEQTQLDFRNTLRALGGAGVLLETDLDELGQGVRAAYELLRDGRWHTRTEIERATGQLEGLRRMRELRRWFVIERRRRDGRLFEYRLGQRECN
jgi:hypothetical protein